MDYIAGFFDGEGCVTLSIRRSQSCKYSYRFQPIVDIGQRSRPVLANIQRTLQMGCLRKRGGYWRLTIAERQQVHRFVTFFSERSQLKRKQLRLLREALGLLPRRGGWRNTLPKSNVIRLLAIVKKIRDLNGIHGKRAHDINAIREHVRKFSEYKYRKRIKSKWRARNAALVRLMREQRNRRFPPATIRQLYWRHHLSIEKVATRLGCSPDTIHRQMVEHNIPRRVT